MIKRIILCADDYGQNAAISQAIIDLIAKNRLSATSCMANSDDWPEHAKWLQPYQDQVHIGLHINFTDGKPLSSRFQRKYGEKMFSLHRLLMGCMFKMIDKTAIYDELNVQLDQFISATNQLPHFLDGHQHVHHFPVIRDALLDIYEKRLKGQGIYIRNVHDDNVLKRYREDAYIKKIIIQFSGAAALLQELKKRNIPHNTSFSGIYDFSQANHFAAKFQDFLEQSKDGGLIMCHPGFPSSSTQDPIYSSRHLEYEYLLSDAFLQECKNRFVSL
jgi:predicted glycoside hydrolase/deacetylase ChbG (UPF0249 family)